MKSSITAIFIFLLFFASTVRGGDPVYNPFCKITIQTSFLSCDSTACVGKATAMVSGNMGVVSYSWNSVPPQFGNTAFNLCKGVYTVTAKDSFGCMAVKSVYLGPIRIDSLKVQNVKCNGAADGSAEVFVSGESEPYTYSWTTITPATRDSVTGLDTGKFLVFVTDSLGCSTYKLFTISQPPHSPFTATIKGTNPSCMLCTDGSVTVTVTGGSKPYTYSWNTIPVQITPTATNLGSGTYTVLITDSSGCSGIQTIMISPPTGIVFERPRISCIIYPNPATEILFLDLNSRQRTSLLIQFTNLIGELVLMRSIECNGKETESINLSSLQKGLYFITIQNGAELTIQRLVVK